MATAEMFTLKNEAKDTKNSKEMLGDGVLSQTEINAVSSIKDRFDKQMKDEKNDKNLNKIDYKNTKNTNELYTLISDKFNIPESQDSKREVIENFYNEYIFDLGQDYFFGSGDKELLDPTLLKLRYPHDKPVQDLPFWNYRAIEDMLKVKLRTILQDKILHPKETKKINVSLQDKARLEKQWWIMTASYQAWNGPEISKEDKTKSATTTSFESGKTTAEIAKDQVDSIRRLLEDPTVDPNSLQISIQGSASNVPPLWLENSSKEVIQKANKQLAYERSLFIKDAIVKKYPQLEKNILIQPSIIWWPEFWGDHKNKNDPEFIKNQWANMSINYKQSNETRYDLKFNSATKDKLMLDTLNKLHFTENIVMKLKVPKDEMGREEFFWSVVPGCYGWLKTSREQSFDKMLKQYVKDDYLYLQLDISSRHTDNVADSQMSRNPISKISYDFALDYTPKWKKATYVSDGQWDSKSGGYSQVLNLNDSKDDMTAIHRFNDLNRMLVKDINKESFDVNDQLENRKTRQLEITDREWLSTIKWLWTDIYGKTFTDLEAKKEKSSTLQM